MELMQKYAKDDGTIGLETEKRWPSSSAPVKFLSTTASAASVKELKQVSRIDLQHQ
jgi:hypothetical protein